MTATCCFNGIFLWSYDPTWPIMSLMLCARELKKSDVEQMQKHIILILCKLEAIFPPAFFTIMVHLCIHLPEQIFLTGPVHYTWMFPIDRYVHTTDIDNYIYRIILIKDLLFQATWRVQETCNEHTLPRGLYWWTVTYACVWRSWISIWIMDPPYITTLWCQIHLGGTSQSCLTMLSQVVTSGMLL